MTVPKEELLNKPLFNLERSGENDKDFTLFCMVFVKRGSSIIEFKKIDCDDCNCFELKIRKGGVLKWGIQVESVKFKAKESSELKHVKVHIRFTDLTNSTNSTNSNTPEVSGKAIMFYEDDDGQYNPCNDLGQNNISNKS